ncbi:MAG: septum formation initiator family protein [Tissierellia bacterium]|nr:septum formation initiator family protein [Tissierellia bacterium]
MEASKRIKKMGVKKNPPKRRKKTQSLRTLSFSMAILLMLFAYFTFSLRASVSSLDNQLASQKKEIEDLDKTKKSLASQLEGIKNSEEIINVAKFQLGMVYPEEDQLVYLDVPRQETEEELLEHSYLNPVISVLKFFK